MKIIGVELRIQFHDPKKGPTQKEIAIIPCDVTVHLDRKDTQGYYMGNASGNGTIHTDCGDLGFTFGIPDNFLDEQFTTNRLKAEQKL